MTITEIKEKVNKQREKGFLGRHQQLLFVDSLLGKNISELEMTNAFNLDKKERESINEEVNYQHNYISQFLSSKQNKDSDSIHFFIEHSSSALIRIIKNANSISLLGNDRELKDSLYKLLSDVYSLPEVYSWANGTEMIGVLYELKISLEQAAFYENLDLGKLINSSERQNAWVIIKELVFQKEGHLRACIGILCNSDPDFCKTGLNNLDNTLIEILEKGNITEDEFKLINEIKQKAILDKKLKVN